MRAGIAIAIVSVLVACGGEDLGWWESVAAGERIFLLNKRTGDLYTVQDGEIRPVVRNLDEPWEGQAKPVDHERAARMHSLNQSAWLFDDVVKVSVNSKYRDGQVELHGTIEPYIKGLSELPTCSVFTLEFQEFGFFRVVDTELESSDLVQTVGSDGQPRSYAFTKRLPVAPEDWQEASLLSVQWTDPTDKTVSAWKQQHPEDTAKRKALAAAEREAERARLREGTG